MEKQQSPFTLIKKGFLLGIGLMIPLAVLEFASVKYAFYESKAYTEEMTSNWSDITADFKPSTALEQTENDDKADNDDTAISEMDRHFSAYNQSYAKDIRLSPHQTTMQNDKLLVIGSFTNSAKVPINTVEIEAELFKDGKFVYECSDYIGMTIKPGQSENYMIKCGCNKGDTPAFDEVKVKVNKALAY